MSENKYLKAALKYASQYDWAVFPVSSKSKKPLTPNGCKDAKKTAGAINNWWKKWPDAAIGVATGSISKLVIIDLDLDEDKGHDGYHELTMWERDNGALPDSVRALTGRGGNHIYYHYEGNDIRNRTCILDGIDIRGEGGYIIAPPSLHPNGTEYAWENDPDDTPFAEVDDQVRKFLAIGASEPTKKEFKVPERIKSGERNNTLFRMACSMQAQGFPDAAIMAALRETNEKACDEPLPDEELEIVADSALKYEKGELKVLANNTEEWHEPKLVMLKDKDGNETDRPAQTIANCEEAIAFDKELFGRIRWNDIAYSVYVYGNLPWEQHKGWREWRNVDDSNLRSYIEQKYGMKSGEKVMDALANVASRNHINPIQQTLEECHEQWDGNKYVENLLPYFLGAEKSEYTTAAMRLFMLGAVSRIYHPGCKFDYMIVLVGEQGKGKSSFLRFLTLNDEWFNDNFNTLDGDKAFEKLRGMWIVELGELQATKRAKDVESVKSFITSRVDVYRAPYGRRTEQRPRMCVLAGTSNPVDFLTDKTGNRRFIPVTCNVTEAKMDMFKDEIATKAIFCQAWGEIMDEYLRANGRVKLVLPNKLQTEALRMQERYQEEDPKIGIIQEWLDKTDSDRVCAAMIWKECLGHLYDDSRPQDINAIHDIMKNSIHGWEARGKQRCGTYGTQRCYDRTETDFAPVDKKDTPFDKNVAAVAAPFL